MDSIMWAGGRYRGFWSWYAATTQVTDSSVALVMFLLSCDHDSSWTDRSWFTTQRHRTRDECVSSKSNPLKFHDLQPWSSKYTPIIQERKSNLWWRIPNASKFPQPAIYRIKIQVKGWLRIQHIGHSEQLSWRDSLFSSMCIKARDLVHIRVRWYPLSLLYQM